LIVTVCRLPVGLVKNDLLKEYILRLYLNDKKELEYWNTGILH
jgi:hypothetical protein